MQVASEEASETLVLDASIHNKKYIHLSNIIKFKYNTAVNCVTQLYNLIDGMSVNNHQSLNHLMYYNITNYK